MLAEHAGDVGDARDPEDGWRRASPRLARLRRLEVALVGVAAASVVLAVGLELASSLLLETGLAVVAVAWVVGDTLLRQRARSWRYQERAEDLLIARGLLVRRLSVVPYGRMQLVDVTAGPAERLFGLATVKMHTAAATSDGRVPGLEAAEATRLRDQLAALGESKAAGL